MTFRYAGILVLICFTPFLAWAQCGCDNCPVPIISNQTTNGTIDISGAVNDQLGSNGQRLCRICVDFVHDAPDELDFFLISPSGSSVQLIENSGLSVNENISFQICFLTCDQVAEPDPGFPPVFDSGAGWQPNQTYTGTYYPFDPACLESLTGNVNGTWTLQMTDNVGLDDGTLNDWYLVFEDDNGIGCEHAGECGESCLADAGVADVPPDTFCVGDPALMNSTFAPVYDGVNNIEPPAGEYGYTWVVAETLNGAPVIEISANPDLSTYPPGTYTICGYSYLLADEPLIPIPDGIITLDDLETQISNGDICADIMDNCRIRTIAPQPGIPDFDGPLEVCIGQPEEWVVLNADPLFQIDFQVLAGSISQFTSDDNSVIVAWTSGPATLCATITTACGSEQTCLSIEVIDQPEPELMGEFEVCGGEQVVYTVTPPPGQGESYVFTVTNGTVINQTDDEVIIEWSENAAFGEICFELMSPTCPVPINCVGVSIDNSEFLPGAIDVPLELCIGENAIAGIPFDPAIIDYVWSASGLNILSGQGTNSINLSGELAGAAQLCIDIETDCGFEGPLCEDILVFENPQPTINPVEPTCALSVDLEAILSSGGTGTWSQTGGPPGVLFDDVGDPTTYAAFPGTGIFTLQFAEINGPCEGIAEIEIEILPELEVSDPMFDCNINQEYIVTFDILSGEEPYTVNGDLLAGSSFTSTPFMSGSAYLFEVTDNIGCSIIIEGLYDCPCISDAGTMPGELVEVCDPTGETAIVLNNGDAVLDGNDIGEYILHDGSGNTLGTILDRNIEGVFSFLPGMNYGQVYYISFVVGDDIGGSVDLLDLCLSVAIGQPVVFYTDPQVELSGPQVTCEFTFEITGIPSSDVTDILWTQLSGPGNSSFNPFSGVPTLVTVDEQGTYVFQVILSNNACTSTVDISIDVSGTPEIIQPEEVCDQNAEFYTLSFTVIGGEEPYSASIPGIFNGNQFTSEPIPSGEGYSVTVTDNNGCESNLLVGDKFCDCITSAGTMSSQLIEICDSIDAAIAMVTGNAELDANDIAVYYLHTGSGTGLEVVLDSNTTGIFNFIEGMFTDSIYYISLAAGDSLGNFVDPSDPCYDLAQGQPVIWYSLPQISTGFAGSACTDTLMLTQSPASGVWEIISSPVGSNIILLNLTDSTTTLTADSAGAYTLVWTAINPAGCEASDTLTLFKLPSPVISEIVTTCSPDLQSYTVTFVIAGDVGPYMVNGQTSGPLFMSAPVEADSAMTFIVTGGSGCESILDIGPVSCNCLTDAGTTSGSDVVLCEDEELDVLIGNDDQNLDPDDTLSYILHDGPSLSLGNVLVVSYGNPILFGPPLTAGQTYTLSVVAGNSNGGAIDLSDPCLDIAGSISVTWKELTSVSVDSNLIACVGSVVQVAAQVVGEYPAELTLTNDFQDTMIVSLSEVADSLAFDVIPGTMTWNLIDVAGVCIGNFSGSITIEGQDPLDVSFTPQVILCDRMPFGASIALSDLIDGAPVTGLWGAPGLIIQNDSLITVGASPGTYMVALDTRSLEDPCPGNVFTTEVVVIECNCPMIDLPGIIEECNSFAELDLGTLIPQSIGSIWSLENPLGYASPPVVVGDVLEILGSDAGMYSIVLELTDSLSSLCETLFTIDLVIEDEASSGQQFVFPDICNDGDGLNLTELLEGADPGGVWTIGADTIGSFILPGDYSEGSTLFVYTVPGTGNCPSVSTDVTVNIVMAPVFSFIATNPACFGDANGSIEVVIEDQGDGPYTLNVEGVPQSSAEINGLATGSYDIEVENTFGCLSEVNTVILTEPEMLSVNLGPDKEVSSGELVTIVAEASAVPGDSLSYEWEDSNSGKIMSDSSVINITVFQNTEVRLTISDSAGCTASDAVGILVKGDDVYLPNVFNPTSQSSVNSVFGPVTSPAVESIDEFRIFDRWGELVFEAVGMLPGSSGTFWDGSFNGKVLMPGVYVYALTVSVNGSEEVYAGSVTLVR